MAQRHKGERKQIASLLTPRVRSTIVALSKNHRMSVSQYVADLLAIQMGRPDLARDLRQLTIPEELHVVVESRRDISPRFDHDVHALIEIAAAARGMSLSQYVAAVCTAHVDGGRLPEPTQEVLLLSTA